jgi:transporter family-2 protein
LGTYIDVSEKHIKIDLIFLSVLFTTNIYNMNQQLLSTIAFLGGVCLAIQSGFSTQLGSLLKKPIIASMATYTSGALFALIFVLFFSKDTLNLQSEKQIPTHLWIIGGLFSVTGITLYYFTIPKLGIAKMMSLGLCGQLIFSIIAGHFGWFDLPLEPISTKKVIGATAMIIGIIFINSK